MIFRKIRENTDPRIFLLEAWTVFYSFAAAASRSDWPSSLPEDPAALVRMAIPAVTVLAVLLLRNASTRERSTAARGDGHRYRTCPGTRNSVAAGACVRRALIGAAALARDAGVRRRLVLPDGVARRICRPFRIAASV